MGGALLVFVGMIIAATSLLIGALRGMPMPHLPGDILLGQGDGAVWVPVAGCLFLAFIFMMIIRALFRR